MRKRIFVVIISAIAILMGVVADAGDAATGEKLYLSKGCIGCHGPGGNSSAPKMYPATAGLEESYIVEQVKAFREGTRKNAMMSPMASMVSEEEAANIAAYLASQPRPEKK